MIRILIVDDEPKMLRDLVTLVQQIDENFVISHATNAIEAQSLIEQNAFDIVITDIHMPVMNGLELITWLKDRNDPAIPVVISGYSYFEYARTAMKLGVTDYLLRPADPVEIAKVLSSIVEKIEIKRAEQKRLDLQQAIRSIGSSPDGVLSQDEAPFVAVFCAGSLTDSVTTDEAIRLPVWQDLHLEAQLKVLLAENESVWIFRSSQSTQTALFSLNTTTATTRYAQLMQQICLIQGAGYGLAIAVSPLLESIAAVGSMQKKLMVALHQRLVLGQNQLLVLERNPALESIDEPSTTLVDDSGAAYETLRTLIRYQGAQAAKVTLLKLVSGWKNQQLPLYRLERELRRLAAELKPALSGSHSQMTIDQLEEICVDALANALNYDSLWDNLAAIFDGLDQDTTRVNPMDRHENLACQIAAYIENNLASPLNNSILGKMFGLAPSYLSVIFRNKKGLSPIEYIAMQRINRAKALFCESPHLTTKDISTLVGFDDPFHFSKTFKKLTGLSPTEYRKTNCQNKENNCYFS